MEETSQQQGVTYLKFQEVDLGSRRRDSLKENKYYKVFYWGLMWGDISGDFVAKVNEKGSSICHGINEGIIIYFKGFIHLFLAINIKLNIIETRVLFV